MRVFAATLACFLLSGASAQTPPQKEKSIKPKSKDPLILKVTTATGQGNKYAGTGSNRIYLLINGEPAKKFRLTNNSRPFQRGQTDKFEVRLNDYDGALVNYLADQFKKSHNFEVRKDRKTLSRLREAAKIAAEELTQKAQAVVRLPSNPGDPSAPKPLEIAITREQFDRLTAGLVDDPAEIESLRLVNESADMWKCEVITFQFFKGGKETKVLRHTPGQFVSNAPERKALHAKPHLDFKMKVVLEDPKPAGKTKTEP